MNDNPNTLSDELHTRISGVLLGVYANLADEFDDLTPWEFVRAVFRVALDLLETTIILENDRATK